MQLLVTGSLAYDYIMDYPGLFADRIMPDKIHAISLSFLVDKMTKKFGGNAPNIAYSLKLLGTDPLIVATAGKDFGEYDEFLTRSGLSTAFVTRIPTDSMASYFVVTDKRGNQIGSFYTGAMRDAVKIDIVSIVKKMNPAITIIAPNDPAAMNLYAHNLRQIKHPYVYDPAFEIELIGKDALKAGIEGASMLFGNDYEIALIEKILGITHEELLLMTPLVITTLAEKGSIIETRKDMIHIKPTKVKKVLDPTGAGDAYRSGFLAGYVREYDLVTCGQMGSVAAAYAIEQYGTIEHSYTTKQFSKRFTENYKTSLSL